MPNAEAGRKGRFGTHYRSQHAQAHQEGARTGSALGVKVASEGLGHSKVGITLDLYSHVLPGMQEDAAARVDEAYQIAEKRRAEEIG
jgi:hypothetical protein